MRNQKERSGTNAMGGGDGDLIGGGVKRGRRPLKGVIFDLYGTLVYTPGSDFWVRYGHLEKSLGHLAGFPSREAVLTGKYESLWGREFLENDCWCSENEAMEEILNGCMLYEGCLETIRALKQMGLKIGVISNVASPYKRPFYALGLDKDVDQVVFSCDVGLHKPDPRIFDRLNSDFRIDPDQWLFCGDSLANDIALARSCGIRSALVQHESHKVFACSNDDEYVRFLNQQPLDADLVVVKSLKEIVELVKQMNQDQNT